MSPRYAVLIPGCLAMGCALAQALSDPTRPADIPTASSASVQGGGAGQAARLQSVLIAGDRKLATIDGRTIGLGGRVGDATVSDITETTVTLRRGSELTVLHLYPAVVRTPGKRSP
jgi:MSHA biogenesis protein MshK